MRIRRYSLNSIIIAVIVFSLPLSGCVAGLAAGAAGSYVGTKHMQQTKRKRDQTTQRHTMMEARKGFEAERRKSLSADFNIAAQVNKRLISGELTKIISIHTVVRDGMVSLYGNVPDERLAQRAVEIASSIPGVREVRSNLVVVEVKISPPDNVKIHKSRTKPAPPVRPSGQGRPPSGTEMRPPPPSGGFAPPPTPDEEE